ncbi:polysaccharide biosynthesis protein [Parabacteroides pacaensis]|uniref:polysaccharide biosynthesis protein n=1 Tax=Parabacteroides pacaensis TaxID=2086575 RepID=UPI000D10A2F4|nr:nucleoside-diphosphate sugar epimerase/dehydratase [Parabacteroides pacaensis]
MLSTLLKRLAFRLARIKYLNRWIIFGIDVFASVVISILAYLLIVYVTNIPLIPHYILALSIFSALTSIFSFLVWRVYKGVVRHTTLPEVWRIGAAVLLKVLLLLFVVKLATDGFSSKQLLLGFLTDLFATTTTLVTIRVFLINIYNQLVSRAGRRPSRILVYGTDSRAVSIAGMLTQNYLTSYRIVGYLTIGSIYKHFRISGQPVYFIKDIESFARIARRTEVQAVLFPSYKSAQEEKDRLVTYCQKLKIQLLVAPPFEEMKNGRLPQPKIREVQIEDLLGREEIKINLEEISGLLKDKVILVTGAAGSIGSEICRQLTHFPIKKLICFDSAETPMHNLRLELEDKYPGLNFVPVIGDVRSKDRIDYVFRNWHPCIVFHAAAYKHVPLMEENPCEAVRVNVYGTRLVADASVQYHVEKFVMISTDKAVNPTNIMGCSKRLAEIYVQSLSIAISKGEVKGETKFITTRFGNVLGSNGSVIPRFREQIKNGGPVTVTDPEIIRYFMTIPEACRLVLEAGTMGKGGEIFIFDMGEPVRIADLASRMIELSGMEVGKDIEIKYTGLRPGEKLYEELLSHKENTKETPHEKIRVARVREHSYQEIVPEIDNLIKLSSEVRILDMVKEMKLFVPEFKSNNSQFEKLDLKKIEI